MACQPTESESPFGLSRFCRRFWSKVGFCCLNRHRSNNRMAMTGGITNDIFNEVLLQVSALIGVSYLQWPRNDFWFTTLFIYWVVQLQLTPEIEVFCMLFNRSFCNFTIASLKQHIHVYYLDLIVNYMMISPKLTQPNTHVFLHWRALRRRCPSPETEQRREH